MTKKTIEKDEAIKQYLRARDRLSFLKGKLTYISALLTGSQVRFIIVLMSVTAEVIVLLNGGSKNFMTLIMFFLFGFVLSPFIDLILTRKL